MTSVAGPLAGKSEGARDGQGASVGPAALNDDDTALSNVNVGRDAPLQADAERRPRRDRSGRLRRHLIWGDVAGVVAGWAPQALVHPELSPPPQFACVVAAAVATMAVLQRAGLYRARVCAVRSLEVVRVIDASLAGAGAFAISQWLASASTDKFGWATGAHALEGASLTAFVALVLRWRFNRWLKMKRAGRQFLRTVVLVGTNEDALGVWTLLNDEPELGYQVVAVAGQERLQAPWDDVPTSSDVGRAPALARMAGANGVLIVGSSLGPQATYAVVDGALAAGLHVEVWPGLLGLSLRRVRMTHVLGVPALYVEPRRTPRWALPVKRFIDVSVTVALLPFALPVLLVSALLVKLEDGGPVLHHHAVVGRYGQLITVLKLRTMVPNAEQMKDHVSTLNERSGGPLFKASDDPRVTRVGRFLRATSLDELPQLWDVLKGTMSLVGPRFALPSEAEHFDPELRRRTNMRPGMTGLWQSEARDNPFFSAYRRLDLFYIDNWSLSLDVAILFNTAHSVGVRALRVGTSVLAGRRTTKRTAADLTESEVVTK